MIQINKLKTLENISDCYYITDNLDIININTNHIKKQTLGKRGYYYITLSNKNGKQTNVPIHKINALSYIKNDYYEVINHIDGNKLNNNINNLEFITQKENVIHSWNIGMTTRDEEIFEIDKDNQIHKGTIKELAKLLNIPKATLYDLYYKQKSSDYHNVNYIIKVNRLSKN